MNLLSGLEKFGLSTNGELDITKEGKEPEKSAPGQKEPEKVLKESDFLLEKVIQCTVCDRKFKTLIVKTGKAKISGTVTMLDGTRRSISPKTVGMSSNGDVTTSVEVKNLGTANVEIEGGGFHGDLDGYEMASAEVGGPWNGSAATVAVDIADLSMFSGEVQEDLLPYEVSASVSRGRFRKTFFRTTWRPPSREASGCSQKPHQSSSRSREAGRRRNLS